MDLIEGYKHDCPLCRLAQDGEVLTRLYYQDDKIIVVDCLICRLPMVVVRAHRDHFTEDERNHARTVLRGILATAPGGGAGLIGHDHHIRSIPHLEAAIEKMDSDPDHRWVIDFEQRQIPDHPHCHLRPFHFPGTSQWEYLD